MISKHVVVLGATGYIGSAITQELKSRGHIVKEFSRQDSDYTDMSLFRSFLNLHWNNSPPHFITNGCTVVNAAGYTGKPNVDRCEIEKHETILGNVVFPARLAQVCANIGVKLVHVSSGCIYDGYEKDFTEEDPPNFCWEADKRYWKERDHHLRSSFYSGSKAMAEELVQVNRATHVLRLRIPFDQFQSPRNYITKMLNYGKLLNLPNSFSHRGEFARVVCHAVEGDLPYGVYNATNPGAMSTDQVVKLISKYIGPKKAFAYYDSYEQFREDVYTNRSNCVLDTDKLSKTPARMRPIEEAMTDTIKKYVPRSTS